MKSEKGQSLVETALILPVLLLLLFGIVDFGRVLHVYLTIDHAGREIGRLVSVQPDTDLSAGNVDKLLRKYGLDADKLTQKKVSIKDGNVYVDLTYEIDFLTPIIASVIKDITLNDSTVMRVEE